MKKNKEKNNMKKNKEKNNIVIKVSVWMELIN